VRVPVIVVAAILGLAGCTAAGAPPSSGGSESPSPGDTGSSAPGATGSAAAGAGHDRCHTGQLAAAFSDFDAGAGQRYALLSLTNRSDVTCTMYGYPGMLLQDAAGHPVATDVRRDPDAGPVLFPLAPGHAAWARLHWTAMPSADEPQSGDCEPPAAAVIVTPPDETDHLTVAKGLGPVCAHGRIDVGAMSAQKPTG
jgi:Domain of unknown function (DUF4232)